MKLEWTGVVTLLIIIGGVIGALALGGDELASALVGVLLGSFAPQPFKFGERK